MKINKSPQLPKFLQPFLWSVKIEDLDSDKDKIYIINQILAFGNIKALKWLFETYPLIEIKQIFLKHSMKIYRKESFNFVRKILLNIDKPVNQKKYVATIF